MQLPDFSVIMQHLPADNTACCCMQFKQSSIDALFSGTMWARCEPAYQLPLKHLYMHTTGDASVAFLATASHYMLGLLLQV